MIAAVVPAAGASRRMGQPKLALPIAGRTVLEHVISALRQAGVTRIVLVLGPHVANLADLARGAGAEPLLLSVATPDMRTTVEHGLDYLERTGPPDDWLLVPADHPTLDPVVVRQLLQAHEKQPDKSIVLPTWQGRRGHPTLITWKHVAGIRAHPTGEGLNLYLRRHEAETLEVPVSSPGVVEDLDTPEDYARVLSRIGEDHKG